ncbi:MAG: ATP-binding domain-containing protein [Acidimicrobiaceae bacterium]|nr:ATP-binding domain-containing protein [Acidimicrobiaceae bacterium]
MSRFADDGAVRILTIHKSKGLEFHTVVVLGVETETFWGKPADERAAFFVGISRAQQRLELGGRDTLQPGGFRGGGRRRLSPHAEFLGYVEAVTS